MAPGKKLLVIDDEENMRHVLKVMLEREGYDVRLAADGREGLEALEREAIDTVLCDLRMPGMDGLEFLKAAAGRNISATIITMSAYGTIDLAIETMKLGAYDYISKPFKPAEIILALKKAEERERLKKENIRLRQEVEHRYDMGSIIGKSAAILTIFSLIKKVAGVKSSVLITGESGTGKELVAKAIHYNSARRNKTFLAVNCGAIPEALLESELFGHKQGAFTGADRDRRGLFEEAAGGTILLDEIGDLPASLQVKLLRVLQEGEVRRVGAERSRTIDVRVMAATAKNLADEVASGGFRQDLYYRLNVLPIHLPPLRERREDIPLLIDHFIIKHNAMHGLAVRDVTPAVRAILQRHDWPGNVRELENMIERGIVLAEKDFLDVDVLPETLTSRPQPDDPDEQYSIKKLSRLLEKRLIAKALAKTGGNKSRAAKLLEISYPALLAKIEEYQISMPKKG